MLVFVLLSFLAMSSMAQIRRTGPCEVRPMTNFDPAKWTGRWYAYAHSPLQIDDHARCIESDNEMNPDGTMRVLVKQITDGPNGERTDIISVEIANENGSITVISPKDSPLYNYQFWIITTDYESYTIKETCQNDGSSSIYTWWIITKSPNPSQKVLENIQQALREEGIEEEYFMRIDQSNCLNDF